MNSESVDGSMKTGGQTPLFPKDIYFTDQFPERTDDE